MGSAPKGINPTRREESGEATSTGIVMTRFIAAAK